MNELSFAQQTGVSRETLEKLSCYASLLSKWQKAINLVSNASIPHMWERHIFDSYQILKFAPDTKGTWIDFGSGAGFPALVVAMISDYEVHVVESDQRKCQFMREVSRETSTPITVHNTRIEQLEPFKADVISARALASLDNLLKLTGSFATENTRFLFLKGQDVDAELTNAAKYWNMISIKHQSLSSNEGCILEIRNIHPL
jgi:16S rRNA (guanine527-N7)-methyltransferase